MHMHGMSEFVEVEAEVSAWARCEIPVVCCFKVLTRCDYALVRV